MKDIEKFISFSPLGCLNLLFLSFNILVFSIISLMFFRFIPENATSFIYLTSSSFVVSLSIVFILSLRLIRYNNFKNLMKKILYQNSLGFFLFFLILSGLIWGKRIINNYNWILFNLLLLSNGLFFLSSFIWTVSDEFKLINYEENKLEKNDLGKIIDIILPIYHTFSYNWFFISFLIFSTSNELLENFYLYVLVAFIISIFLSFISSRYLAKIYVKMVFLKFKDKIG